MAKYKIIYHRPQEAAKKDNSQAGELWQLPPDRRARRELDMEEIARINAGYDEEAAHKEMPPRKRSFWRSSFWPSLIFLAFVFWTIAEVLTPLSWPDIGFLKDSSRLAQDPDMAALKSAVVIVEVPGKSGSGFNIDEAGLIITNKHVVGENGSCSISFADGSRYSGEVIWQMDDYDIALIDIPASGLPFVQLAPEDAQAGEPLVFVGNPMGFDWTISQATCLGVIPRGLDDLQVMYMQGPVRPGSSGSPVYNSDGEVVGVVFASLTEKEDMGLAIPASVLHPVITEILNSQKN